LKTDTLREADFQAEAYGDNPVLIPFRIIVLRKLGDGAGSPGGASTCRTTNHHRRVGAGYSTGFHHRPADPDYDQGCGTRRNPDAARFD
jgi:hypothetical protein